jgi:glycosyltransferase involved in cell wall biosynthesis
MKKKINIVIDASRIRSGGAIIYIKNFINSFNINKTNINKIILFSYKSLLNQITNKSNLIKKNHPFLEKNIFFQILWQIFILPIFLKKNKIEILYSTDSTTFSTFKNSIIFNQDILSFDDDYMKKINFSLGKIRLWFIKFLQVRAMNKCAEIIFLSNFSKKLISKYLYNKNSNIIYHGSEKKLGILKNKKSNSLSWNFKTKKKINLIYVSPLFDYKNHLTVVKSYDLLKRNYGNLDIKFVGSYDHNLKLFNNLITNYPSISKNNFYGELNHDEVLKYIYKSDIFIFASSVEAFGITLLEGMTLGMPIVCSNKSSLPEILKNGGIYFDPDNHLDLSRQIEKFIKNIKLRRIMSNKSYIRSQNFSWERNLNQFYRIINRMSK